MLFLFTQKGASIGRSFKVIKNSILALEAAVSIWGKQGKVAQKIGFYR